MIGRRNSGTIVSERLKKFLKGNGLDGSHGLGRGEGQEIFEFNLNKTRCRNSGTRAYRPGNLPDTRAVQELCGDKKARLNFARREKKRSEARVETKNQAVYA